MRGTQAREASRKTEVYTAYMIMSAMQVQCRASTAQGGVGQVYRLTEPANLWARGGGEGGGGGGQKGCN
jgi:hypothetical protein